MKDLARQTAVPVAAPEIPCRRFLELVRFHRLGPWLFHRLGTGIAGALRHELAGELRTDYRQSVVASMVREAAVRELLQAAHESDLSIVLLKGMFLAARVYPDPALRIMEDVDVLVRAADMSRCREIVAHLRYVPASIRNPGFDPVQERAESYFRSGTIPASLDLHREIWALDHYVIPQSVLLGNRVIGELYGYPVWFLSAELNFVHLALHMLNHGPLLRDWLDLTLLCRTREFDWERMIALAAACNALAPLRRVCEELAAAWTVPEHLIAALRTYRPTWLERRLIRGPAKNLWRWYARLAGIGDRSARRAYIAAQILPSREYRTTFVGSSSLIRYFVWKAEHLVRLILR